MINMVHKVMLSILMSRKIEINNFWDLETAIIKQHSHFNAFNSTYNFFEFDVFNRFCLDIFCY